MCNSESPQRLTWRKKVNIAGLLNGQNFYFLQTKPFTQENTKWFLHIKLKQCNLKLLFISPCKPCHELKFWGAGEGGQCVNQNKSDPGFGALEGRAQQVMRQVCCDDSRCGGRSLQRSSTVVLLQPWSAGPVWYSPGQVWVPPAECQGHNFLHPCGPFERNRTAALPNFGY